MKHIHILSNDKLHNISLAVLVILMLSYTVVNVTQYIETDTFSITAINGTENYTGLQIDDYFSFERRVCIEKDTVVEVSREIFDIETKQKFMLPNVKYVASENDSKPCHDLTFITYVPEILEPGKYYYNPTLFYKVNPIKSVTRKAPGVYFEVVE